MIFSKEKASNVMFFNAKMPILRFGEGRNAKTSILFISKVILILGITLILFNNMQYILPGTYFGIYSWVTLTVFSLGLMINFISIPALYFSSFNKFKQEIDNWDAELFWILPMFFFGTFYMYGSNLQNAIILLALSTVIILGIHLKFISDARRFIFNGGYKISKMHKQYFMDLEYLSVYYVLLVFVVLFFDPLQNLFMWIRWNF